MDLSFTPDELVFRDEVRSFIARELPAEVRERVRGGLYFNKADCVTWQKILHEKGWIAPGWPQEHGGTDWSPTQRHSFEDECAKSKYRLAMLKTIATSENDVGAPLIEDPGFRRKIAQLEIKLTALELTDLRALAKADDPHADPMPSALKVLGSEIQQAIGELLVEALGYYALPYAPVVIENAPNTPAIGPDYAAGWVEEHLHGRAATIYGGSNEIQRNIIAKMVLGG